MSLFSFKDSFKTPGETAVTNRCEAFLCTSKLW